MTATTLTTPAREIPRDHWGRPLVVPRGGGKPVAYTRCTTFIDVVSDRTALDKWKQRMVALGLASRPDLMLAVTATDSTDKKALNRLCEDAMEAAKAHAAATTGTALHALTERIDRGQTIGVIPDAYKADLDAYTETTKPLKSLHIEQFCVLDSLKIGGTPDRIVRYQGKNYIADVKTGDIEYGVGKIAAQLAVYARSSTYDIDTHERGVHGAELDKGLIIHLPAGAGTCSLHWVDIAEGWKEVLVARDVRERRRLKFKDLTEPFATTLEAVTASVEPSLADRIRACGTAEEVRALWSQFSPQWTDELTETARTHIASLST